MLRWLDPTTALLQEEDGYNNSSRVLYQAGYEFRRVVGAVHAATTTVVLYSARSTTNVFSFTLARLGATDMRPFFRRHPCCRCYTKSIDSRTNTPGCGILFHRGAPYILFVLLGGWPCLL